MNLQHLVEQIQAIETGFAKEANKAVNQLLTLRNWLIGFYIVEFEQHGEERAIYGEKTLQTIAAQLNKEGLSYRNLKLFKQFYITFPEIGQTLSAISYSLIGQTVSAQLEESLSRKPSQENKAEEKALLAGKMVQSLSFSHIALLLPLQDDLKQTFYLTETIKGTWSVRELKRQISALLFERSGISQNPAQLIKGINARTTPATSTGLVKDI